MIRDVHMSDYIMVFFASLIHCTPFIFVIICANISECIQPGGWLLISKAIFSNILCTVILYNPFHDVSEIFEGLCCQSNRSEGDLGNLTQMGFVLMITPQPV